jgi:single-strand DNA-binding protein
MGELRLPRINRVMLAGRVVRDFTLRYTANEVPVASFTVAFNRPVKRGEGGWGEVPGFANVLVSHRLAELCAERLRKGSPVYLEGRLQTRKWSGADGRSRSVLEIKADQVQFLDRPGSEGDADEGGADSPPRPVEGDLPF